MSVRFPILYKDMYLGDYSEVEAEFIMKVRAESCIEPLKDYIFYFPKDLVLRSVDEGRSIRDIIRESGMDYSQYIGKLRDYQTVGTAFMYSSPRSMLGDGVGLGKTAEVAALLNFLGSRKELKRFLMAVEPSALAQTTYELMKFTGMRVIAMPGEADKIRKIIRNTDWRNVGGIVIKHSTLRSDAFSKWLSLNLTSDGKSSIYNVFILDEASVIKNPDTKIYRYTENICNLADRVHMLNATPFDTSIMDIYYQFDMANKKLLPSKSRVQKDFCNFTTDTFYKKEGGVPVAHTKWNLSSYKNQEIFKERLKLVYFARCKQDIGMEMPHQHLVYEVQPSSKQLMAIASGHRYMEVLNCPSLIREIKVPTTREEVPKLDRLCTLVENDFSDSRVMVYCFHIEAQQAIANEMRKIGRNPVILNGSCTDEERYEAQEGFNEGKYDILITNIKKSLNLYGGDVCIFYSLETNPSAMEQIHGRIDRNVDDSVKTYVLLLYGGTDEYEYFVNVVKQRAQDARDLTINAKTAVDYFAEALDNISVVTN